jgi:general secretion pathway protein H
MAKKAAKEMPVTSGTGSSGFTLIELLVVLAILVLIAAAWPFAAPRLFPQQQLRNQAQRLLGTLHSARGTARLSGSEHRIIIDESHTGYNTAEGEDAQLPYPMTIGLRDESAAIEQVVFFPDGASNGGTVDLTLAGRHIAIRIGKVTGRAEIIE